MIKNRTKNNFPEARNNDLVLQEAGKELLIYDLEKNKAFGLNETSAVIWSLCDGEKSPHEISLEVSQKLNSEVSEDFVWLALEDLRKDNLVINLPNESYFKGMSRREIIKGIGLSTMIALPIITSLVAPSAANAASTFGCFVGGTCPGEICATAATAGDCEASIKDCCPSFESFVVECSARTSCTCFAKCPDNR
jgi:hypothetical protein